jgi:hypothetical protein
MGSGTILDDLNRVFPGWQAELRRHLQEVGVSYLYTAPPNNPTGASGVCIALSLTEVRRAIETEDRLAATFLGPASLTRYFL